MKSSYLAGTCVASIIAFNMVAFAQTTAPQAAASPALAAQQTTADQQVTITGGTRVAVESPEPAWEPRMNSC